MCKKRAAALIIMAQLASLVSLFGAVVHGRDQAMLNKHIVHAQTRREMASSSSRLLGASSQLLKIKRVDKPHPQHVGKESGCVFGAW